MAKNKKKKKRKILKWILITFLVLVIAVAGACYAGVSWYYKTHFFKGTVINGMDCSNLTVDEVKYKIEDEIMTYTLTIHERNDATEHIVAAEMGMSYVDDASVDKLMLEQEPYTWILHVSGEVQDSVSAASSYDEDMLVNKIKSLEALQEGNYVEPVDAEIKLGEDGYEIVPEVEGTKLKYKKTKKVILAAVEAGQTEVDLDAEGCYAEPDVRSDDKKLNSRMKKANKYLSAKLTYDFGSKKRRVVVDASVIADWLIEADDGSFSLDENAVVEFVKTSMAYKYDTFGLTHEFTTHAGKKITLKGGDYGWCINREETAKEMIEAIKEGKQGEMEPVYKYTAKNRGANDIGDTYIEISIDDQKLWCYKDGKCIVETDVVTGCTSKGNGTPMNSVWAIDAMKKDATLGTMDTMGYESPVDYWMPFTGNVGIHDADWRSEFGGNIYKTNGSHGCVNCPDEAAKKVFENVTIGTAVVVYGTESKKKSSDD